MSAPECLGRLFPVYQVRSHHSRSIQAQSAAVLRAVREFDASQSWVVRLLM